MMATVAREMEQHAARTAAKVISVELFVVQLKKYKPFLTAYGVLGEPHVFVRLEAEDGTVGWGETGHFDTAYSGERWETALINGEHIAKLVIGHSPFEVGRLHDTWDSKLAGNYQIKCAFDLALWDLSARTLNVRLCDLLGGAAVERLDVQMNVPIGTREDVLKDVERDLAFGIKTLGTKAGRPSSPSIEHDVENFKAIRDTFGYGFDLWIDFNAGSTRMEAVQAIKALEPFKLGQVEQPVAGWDLDGMAFIAREVDVPVVADEPVWGAQSVLLINSHHAADIIHAKLPKMGGISGAIKTAAVCEALNLPLTIAGFGLSNYGQAALMHFLASQPICLLYPHKLRAGTLTYPEDVVVSLPRFENGAFFLPKDGPSFGLEIDPERLASLTTERRKVTKGPRD